jgi:hypothetical protein
LRGLLEQVVHLEIDAVGPAEADDVGLIAGRDLDVGRADDDVVLLADGAVAEKVVEDGLRELCCDAVCVGGETELRKAFYGEPCRGGPAVGEVPLGPGVQVAHRDSTGALDDGEMEP